jgi:hypothetical protein
MKKICNFCKNFKEVGPIDSFPKEAYCTLSKVQQDGSDDIPPNCIYHHQNQRVDLFESINQKTQTQELANRLAKIIIEENKK